ncbi:MAG: zf-HC2 domain-containing protein [Acidimicrobiales bacterium]
MTWHASDQLLADYVRGDIDDAGAFSLEAHLIDCDRCRSDVAAVADSDRLANTWSLVEAALDAPVPGPVEWFILRLGVRPHLARLLAATPALRLSWLSAVVMTLAFSVAAAYGGQGERAKLLFLLVAPLLPVAGVAAAFSPGADPTAELTVASPYGGLRLLLVRTVAVMTATISLAGLAALALPGLGVVAAAWLIPALALSVACLAVGTFLRPVTAAGSVAVLWVTGVLVTEGLGAGSMRAFLGGGPLESGAFRPSGQLLFVVVTIVAGAVLAARRDSFEMGRVV